MPEEPRGVPVPLLHIPLVALALGALASNETLTLGSWGDLPLRLAGIYLLPALLLHAWASASSVQRRGPRLAAWLLVGAMCVHSQVLLRPEALAAVALLGALDLALHPSTAPRPRATLGARIVAGLALLAVAGALVFLAARAQADVFPRLGAVVLLAGALAVAAALRPPLRAPQRLLPALGAYYLFFVFVAAPVLPFGPALAWWLLCGSIALGALVAARHVSGHEVPPEQARHVHEVRALPDLRAREAATLVERYLATGDGASHLSERIERARGDAPSGTALPALAAAMAKDAEPARRHRERALRRLLELNQA